MTDSPRITPDTKVTELLRHYPELEDLLIGMAPPFKKLKNPILRRSVARVASLRQAAAVGRISVEDMVNELRAAVGQEAIPAAQGGDDASYFSSPPDWYDPERVVETIVEKELDPDLMPLSPLLVRATRLSQGEIIELITTYVPAPGIDVMKGKGYRTWSVEEGELVRTYFCTGPPG